MLTSKLPSVLPNFYSHFKSSFFMYTQLKKINGSATKQVRNIHCFSNIKKLDFDQYDKIFRISLYLPDRAKFCTCHSSLMLQDKGKKLQCVGNLVHLKN